MANDFLNRCTGLLVIEAINSNPNGDPDADGAPRIRFDERGEISPVSFKRKLRDLVEDKYGPVWLSVKERLSLDDGKFAILESRELERKQVRKELEENDGMLFKEKYWDARIFGNTFLEEKLDRKSIKTGVVQFGMGVSISPVKVEYHTNTKKAPAEEGKNQGMAPMGYKIVSHGVYTMPFFINPAYAHRSGCTKLDIELLKALLPYAYTHNRSAVRPFVEIRQAWLCEHKSPLGSCPDFALIDALSPRRIGNVEQPSVSLNDYELSAGIPDALKEKVSCVDLIAAM